MPRPLRPGTMIAQRYGIGGKPWTSAPGRNGQLAWKLRDYFTSIGRPDSPANAPDLNERSADAFYSIGAPYVALASDWLPIATNWTGLMPMAVARNFGNLAEMYAMVIAVADLGIRPATVDSLMVSNVGAGGEGWPFVDRLPPERACDPTLLDDEAHRLPFFLHYCQRYEHVEKPPYDESNSVWKSKFYGAFVLNHRVVIHAIDATPAQWRGDAGSPPLDRARTAASSPRNDLVKIVVCTRHTG